MPTPFTTVRDVYSLPAAHTLAIDAIRYSYPQARRYWNLPAAGSVSADPAEAAHETRRLLEESIRLHLVSDVPLGVFLSGGLDSSAITAFAAKQMSSRLTTLCVTFDERDYSEDVHAQRVAKKFDCNHIDVHLGAHEFVEEIPRIFKSMDQPSIDGINTYFVAKTARSVGLTVVLSGLGGDELFCGYAGFRLGPRLYRGTRFPGSGISLSILSALLRFLKHERLEKLEFLQEGGPLGAYLAVRGLFPPGRAARLLNSGILPIAMPESPIRTLDSGGYASLEVLLYLQNQLLRDTDVFGMAHSLEIRVPFLDHRLAEYVASLPMSLKMGKLQNKPLLAEAVKDELDVETISRKKMGFTFPLEKWMRTYRKEMDSHLGVDSPVNKKEARRIEGAFNAGRVHWSRSWALSVLKGLAKHGTLPRWPDVGDAPKFLVLVPEMYQSKGGIQVFNQNLMRAIGDAFPTSEIRVVSINDTSSVTDYDSKDRFFFKGCGPRDFFFKKPRMVFSGAASAISHKPTLIICGHMNIVPLALVLSVFCRCKVTLFAHGIEAWGPNMLSRFLARRIDRLLSVSNFTAKKMIAWGIWQARITILPNTVNGEIFRRVRKRSQRDGRVLFTLARLDATERYKGVDQVIKALAEIREKDKKTFRYIIVGRGSDVPRLKSLVEASKLSDSVEFRGFLSDEEVLPLYSEVDLFVMPSRKEGFGIVFLEALACGVPVIAGNKDGSVDALLGGRLGTLVDPDNLDQLRIEILKALNGGRAFNLRDPETLRREVLAHYGYDRFRLEVQRTFGEMLNLQPAFLKTSNLKLSTENTGRNRELQ